ncbi:hypothetical protein M9H77_13436 [Catharanthus roseus]|uniref:Uncharacterized protein n=1 Tax=Catharanthus roseus TaxID=4058 RepID=A0ACC0BK54_CATRO|nr:hypothetical protein M9H77_13436 [Catharanthus roseus]
MGVRLFGNQALVRCLIGFDYEMSELGSDDLVLGSGLCQWSLTVALHGLLNSGVETALTCLDSLKLSSCTRNPRVKHDKPLKSWSWSFGPIFPGRTRIYVLVVLIFWGL